MNARAATILAAELAELAEGARSLAGFRQQALGALQRVVGFDFATVQDARTGTTGWGLSVADPALTIAHARWASAQPVLRAPPLAAGISVCHQGRALDRFKSLSAELSLPPPSSLAARAWSTAAGPIAIGLTRVGRVSAFGHTELAILDAVTPVVSVAETMLAPSHSGEELFDSWCLQAGLTQRQREVAQLVTRGLRNAEIAAVLRCSSDTIRNHLVAIFRKAGVTNKAELTFQSMSP